MAQRAMGLRTLGILGMLTAAPVAGRAQGFFDEWQQRASASQADQPHWITPVFTTTPRLEQEIRYDIGWREAPDRTTTENLGLGKGLELIPLNPVEIIFGVPPYVVHNEPTVTDGWGDFSMLLKYRLASAPEDKGDYIATLFLGATFPTGSVPNGAGQKIVTPTLALGKGVGGFDVQTTLGVALPTDDASRAGHAIAWNATAQYHAVQRVWPEIELNATFWPDGSLKGKRQVFLSPGVVLGRFPIRGRLGFTIGAGVQIAASSFHQYDHAFVVTARLPF